MTDNWGVTIIKCGAAAAVRRRKTYSLGAAASRGQLIRAAIEMNITMPSNLIVPESKKLERRMMITPSPSFPSPVAPHKVCQKERR